MLKKFREINVFTGRPVEEDAPTNATGPAVAGTGDDSSVVVVRRKKDKENKMFLDARTKAYKQHAEKLQKMRERRSKLKEDILSKTDEFYREMFVVENNLRMLKDIVKKKSAKPLKFKDGRMKVDLTTASTITQVYDKVNASNKKKIENMINGTKKNFLQISNAVFKLAR
jgi:hypothetical protein